MVLPLSLYARQLARLTRLLPPIHLTRYASTMTQAHHTPHPEPLVVVMGTTGSGKSDLAVELAVRFNGEVINADAMQMYEGLPIITNKIPPEEQRGIPHHLLGVVALDEPTWNVHRFRREAGRLIREIRSRGRVPVVVGGTHYYLDGLLFKGHLLTGSESSGEDDAQQQPQEPQSAGSVPRDPALDEASTETLLARLREVDPIMAARWHPKDRRKILRSLEIFLTTGRRASDIYAEQAATKKQPQVSEQTQPPLLFWVHAERDALVDRLNHRVDKMMEAGLLDETREMHAYLRNAAHPVDRTTGIWQSIGFSEVEPYLDALHSQQANPTNVTKETLHALKLDGAERIKISTRQYARNQVRWIRKKTLPLVREAGIIPQLFVVDSTDVAQYATEVVGRAVGAADAYLAGRPLPDPNALSDVARKVLDEAVAASDHPAITLSNQTCDVCHTTAVTAEDWEKHIKGHRHRRAVKAASKRALIAERRTMAVEIRAISQGVDLSLEENDGLHSRK